MINNLRLKKILLLAVSFLGLELCVPMHVHAKLWVYEPFNYSVSNLLAGSSGGLGFQGVWADGPEATGTAVIFDQTTATNPVTRGQDLSWDGVVNNLTNHPQTNFTFFAKGFTGDNWEAYRPLKRNASLMAGGDRVLWASMAWHRFWGGWGQHVGFALTSDCFTDRGKQLDTSGSFGSGAGDGIGVAEAFINSRMLSPVVFDGGTAAAITNSPVVSNGDYVLILKFEFGTNDTVSAYAFPENTELSEITFDANAIAISAPVDETTLNYISTSNVRGEPAFDEIRMADTFEEVIGIVLPPKGTVIRLQ